jgi:tellurium resistance protein TerD
METTTSINLAKGEKVDLTKTNPGVKKFKVGLGWNPNTAVSGKTFDVDASAFILGENGKRLSDLHFVFYNNLKSPGELVTHTGDNRTGEGEGDDESLIIDLAKAKPEDKKIVIVATIDKAAEKGQNFGQISGAFIRVVDADTNTEIMKYDLNEDYSSETAVVFGELYERDGEWKFQAVGTGSKEGLAEYLAKY